MPIAVTGLTKRFGGKVVLDRFTYAFPETGAVALMGPSGVGKTTLFRILLGLERPDSGTVSGMDGKSVSVVFHEDRLFPGLTVLQNAEVAGSGGAKWLARLGLGEELNARPDSLSGGMRRRVALARALCRDGEIFLLDEPFQGLDPARKREVLELFRELKSRKFLLLITHDPEEAAFLADEVIQLGPGGKNLPIQPPVDKKSRAIGGCQPDFLL